MKFDFDKSLNAFAIEWYEDHKDMLTPEEMEEVIDEVFEDWATTPIQELGCSPREYFAELSSDDIYEAYLEYTAKNALPTVLQDEICERSDLGDRLIEIVAGATDETLVETTMQVLEEQGNKDVYATYVEWIFDEEKNDDLVLHACEIMQEDADLIRDQLLAKASDATDKVKDRISDIVVYATPCEEGFALLLEKFEKGVDMPLYAAYLGKYGDTRAIPALLKAAETCDYSSFMEIENAVAMLGEECKVERNFADDPTYRIIKGLPKKKAPKKDAPKSEENDEA